MSYNLLLKERKLLKTIEITPNDTVKCAQIGANVLVEIRRVLEEEDIDPHFAIACLASAVCGCLKMSGLSMEDFTEGVFSCDEFWTDEGDNIVFVAPLEDDTKVDSFLTEGESN